MTAWQTNIKEGLRDIWSHKFRSSLTITGVILGVASLFTMFAITDGLTFEMQKNLIETGALERITILSADPPEEQEHLADQSPGQTYQDAVALRNHDLFLWVAPFIRFGASVTRAGKVVRGTLYGVDDGFLELDNHRISHGRYFSDLDLFYKNRVCVISTLLAKDLWDNPEREALGSWIIIHGVSFKVIGLFPHYMTERARRALQREIERNKKNPTQEDNVRQQKKRSSPWNDPFFSQNRAIAIPITTMLATLKSTTIVDGIDVGPDTQLSGIGVGIEDLSLLEVVEGVIQNTIRIVHNGVEDFELETGEDKINDVKAQIHSARTNGTFIAGIGLLVGGLGITNIMLATMVDRIREIGIRRALGAKPRDVLLQFLMESVILSLTGGILGLFLGLGFIQLIILLSPVDTNPIIEPMAIAISLISSIFVGIISGLYPAHKASNLSVLEALNFE
ncbi:MAG: ABC transporter permease [Verrucomicrobiota bacterium]